MPRPDRLEDFLAVRRAPLRALFLLARLAPDRLAAFLAGRRVAFPADLRAAFLADLRAAFLADFRPPRLAAFLAGRAVRFLAGSAAQDVSEAGVEVGVGCWVGGGSIGSGSIQPEPDQPISI